MEEKETLMNLPNREELLFRVVLAFPTASKIGLVAKMRCAKSEKKLSGEEEKRIQGVPFRRNRRIGRLFPN